MRASARRSSGPARISWRQRNEQNRPSAPTVARVGSRPKQSCCRLPRRLSPTQGPSQAQHRLLAALGWRRRRRLLVAFGHGAALMATNCRPSGPCQAPCPVLCRAPCREPASTRRHRGRHHGGAQRGGRRLRGAAIHRRGRMLHIRTPRRCNGPPRRPRNRCGHKLQPQLGPRVGPSQAHRPSRATPVAMQAAPQWWTTEWARQTRARQVTSTGVRWLARPRATAWRRCLTPARGCSVRAPTRRPRSMRLRSCSPLGPAPISTLHPAPRRPTRLGVHLSRTTSPLMRRRPRMWRRPVPTLRLAPRVAASSTRTVGRQCRQAAFPAPPRSKACAA